MLGLPRKDREKWPELSDGGTRTNHWQQGGVETVPAAAVLDHLQRQDDPEPRQPVQAKVSLQQQGDLPELDAS
jgi:hypothetical protein